jgi:hypothetical protein
MNKLTLSFILLISSAYSFAFCKINQYGHSLCVGERALIKTSDVKRSLFPKNEDLSKIYKAVTIRKLHVHEPVAKVNKPGIRGRVRIFTLPETHVDQLLGNKICADSELCEKQKVTINEECRTELDNPKRVYKIKKVYEDQEFIEDIVEIQRGVIVKKRKILVASCLTLRE